MKAIREIQTRLKNYPQAQFKIKDNTVTILPLSETGFEVTMIDNEPHYTVCFDGWHEEYDDFEAALNSFAFGLSDDCRLKISYRGRFPYAWTVEEKDCDGNWWDCQWIGCSTTGLFIAPFWMKKRYVYRQNHLLKSEPSTFESFRLNLGEQDVFDRQFARRIGVLIESGLIWHEHYYPWADEIIMKLESPPYWLLELSTEKDPDEALKIVTEFAYSDPHEPTEFDRRDAEIACIFLRHKRAEINWMSFLVQADKFDEDGNEFYLPIAELENAGPDALAIEQKQRAKVEVDYGVAIATFESLYQGFLEYLPKPKP